MLNKFLNNFKKIDNKIKKIMNYGFSFSLIICLLSIFILYTYHSLNTYYLIFIVGTILFKTSLIIFISFLIYGFIFDTIIKNEL